MADRVAFALYNQDGTPKLDAAPAFIDFRHKKNALERTRPPITNLGGNLYGFTPKASDARCGTAYLIDAGVDALPRFISGEIHLANQPFATQLLTDGAGGLWAGAPPAVSLYEDFSAQARTSPGLNTLAGAYLYTLVPSAADLNIGVAYRIDCDPAASPAFWSGKLVSALGTLSVTKETVLERFPELDGEPPMPDVVWDEILADVGMEIPITSWLSQETADRAAKWLTAHMVVLEKKRISDGVLGATASGQLQEITVGPVTKKFFIPSSPDSKESATTDELLARTEYGREYLRLRTLFCRAKT